MVVDELLERALVRRAALLEGLAREGTDCWRVLHGAAEGRPGLAVDRYGALVLVQTFREPLAPGELERIEGWVHARLGAGLHVVWNHRGGAAREPFERWHAAGPDALAEHVVRELGVRYAIRARHRGQDPWLFLDLRAGRRELARLAPETSVLNLFAYTGTAGVCAAAHGAREVWNVDFARSSLAVAERNLELNALRPGVVRAVEADCLPVLRQLAGLPVKGRGAARAFARFEPRRFDLVVLDPPAWSKGPFGAVDVERDYPALFKPALLACAAGGTVIATNHAAPVGSAQFRGVLERCAAKAGVELAALDLVPPDGDLPPAGAEPLLKIALARRA
jgi:23S rRNA (cytosine1962-C5)-methyltransferase